MYQSILDSVSKEELSVTVSTTRSGRIHLVEVDQQPGNA